MKRFTKKLSNDKVALGKIYEHYVDSFDVDIIYDYQSERAEECGNKFYYGEPIDKLAEYEDLGTVEEFKNLKEQYIIITDARGSGKLITQKALKFDLLQKEFEVYKKALESSIMNSFWASKKLEENTLDKLLKKARKELKNE